MGFLWRMRTNFACMVGWTISTMKDILVPGKKLFIEKCRQDILQFGLQHAMIPQKRPFWFHPTIMLILDMQWVLELSHYSHLFNRLQRLIRKFIRVYICGNKLLWNKCIEIFIFPA